jgi:hypothetical protein
MIRRLRKEVVKREIEDIEKTEKKVRKTQKRQNDIDL